MYTQYSSILSKVSNVDKYKIFFSKEESLTLIFKINYSVYN